MNYRYDGERNSEKLNNMQEAIEYILDTGYGQTVRNEDLGKILGYNIDDELEFKKYKSMMGRVKNFLLRYGYVLKSIAGIGYYILKPSEISKHCYQTYVKGAMRTYDKSLFVLEHTDTTKLGKERMEEYTNIKKLN